MGLSGDEYVLYFVLVYARSHFVGLSFKLSFMANVDLAIISIPSEKAISNHGPLTENICTVVSATTTALSQAILNSTGVIEALVLVYW